MELTDQRLYDFACQVSTSLTDAQLYPFSDNFQAARVAGKWFMLTTILKGKRILILKGTPEDVKALQLSYADILPGYHMNKKHWYTVQAGPSISEKLLEELITDSYLLVVEKLPKKYRPLGWTAHLPQNSE
ncbi:MmcQ/YjbR family DNA-binding protein [Corynebacterium sp. sy017]|uniref:MmcQ/YjbR family DNA-binding protein n=1 Tax=unclassified Corynebacterium TaxID=2624378 RepID=UPI0011869CBD|nr:MULTISPECIES: MmcQ/YjbR family DNA-binding protein [unclassified Corynebacterium]MBP3089167.1 MmcQ/YjbR family DNA-binding protein [Corynebacterium sp. sy017]QDZ42519.1 MmcQ/YjbR family DNA-binding protein [Corynebacterium sp. sy039]TSD91478.1 MmcQ/YjbR family DNA-binding protein [Corynebacterium sp. SY003]